jgi:TRAP-type C4-dicarboxylate transport system permease small subunit
VRATAGRRWRHVRPDAMTARLLAIGRTLRRGSEAIAALMLATMFACFILQIFFRYVLNAPVGWTEELSTLMWIWGILWGAVFVLKERDEVRFDIIYSVVGERARRVFTLITGVALVALYLVALPGVFAYVTFMKVEKSAYLGIRLDYLYSIYLVFAVGAIVRYGWLSWRAFRGEAPETELAPRSTR